VNFQPATPAFSAAAFRGLRAIVGQAGEPGLVGDDLGEGVGRVEQVFRELGGKLRQLFHDRLEARLLVFRQFGAGQAEVADSLSTTFFCSTESVAYSALARSALYFSNSLQVLAELGVEARHLGQHLVVGLAPGRDIVDRMQVADDAPGAAEGLQAGGQRAGEIRPGGGCCIVGQAGDQVAAGGQQRFDGRFDVLGLDEIETGKIGEIEQGIGGGHGIQT
jgi:hypothetical protein